MYTTISQYDFVELFRQYGRLSTPDNSGNFTRIGAELLFGYLEEMEDGDPGIEVDVIALCCDYSEYSRAEIKAEYEDEDEDDSDDDDEEYDVNLCPAEIVARDESSDVFILVSI